LRSLLALEFFPHLPMLLDRRAGSKVFQFEELANLDLTFLALTLRIGRPLGPFDSFFFRLHVDDPITGDQFFGFSKGPINHGLLSSRELDSRSFGARLQSREIDENKTAELLACLRKRAISHEPFPFAGANAGGG